MATGETKMIGPYEIRGTLGKGGMATVYRAYQPNLDREVAVKVMSSKFADDPNFMERFRREALSIAKLDHPNILAVYDFGQANNIPYIVTQLLEGKTLRERMGRPLDFRLAAKITTQIGAALSYAHERGMVHRDVKPSNVLMDKRDRAVLSDFGIVKLMEADSHLTATGLGVGTPEYMSPEQGMGEPLDGRSDLYALGVMLYEMLTGVTPFRADTPLAVMMGHVNRPLPDPSKHNPQLTPAMVAVLQKALAKQRTERYATVDDFAEAFNEAVYASGQPPLAASGGQTGKLSGQNMQGTGTQPSMGAAPAFGVLDSTNVAGNPPSGQPGTGSNPAIPVQKPSMGSSPALPPITGGSNPAFPLPMPPITSGSNPALPPITGGSNPNISQLPTNFQPGYNASQTRSITGPQPPLTTGQPAQPNNFMASPGEATVYSTDKKNPANILPLPVDPAAPTVTAGPEDIAKIAEARRAARAADANPDTQATRLSGPNVPRSPTGEVPRVTGFIPTGGESTVYASGPKTPPPIGPINQGPGTGQLTQKPATGQFPNPNSGAFVPVKPNPPTPPPPSNPTNPQGSNRGGATASTGGTIPPARPVASKARNIVFILIGVIIAALLVIAVALLLLFGGGSPSNPGVTNSPNAAALATATLVITPSMLAASAAAATTAAGTTSATSTAAATTADPVTTADPTATVAPTGTTAPTSTAVSTATSAPTATAIPVLTVLNVGTSRRGDTEIAQAEDVTDQFTAGQEVFGFVHADNANPNLDQVDVTVIKDSITQPVKPVMLSKASGFNFFSLGKIDPGSYKIEVRFNGNLVGKQPEFTVLAAPTVALTTAPVVNKTTAPVVVKTTAPVVKTTAPVAKTTAPPVVKEPTPTPCPPGSC